MLPYFLFFSFVAFEPIIITRVNESFQTNDYGILISNDPLLGLKRSRRWTKDAASKPGIHGCNDGSLSKRARLVIFWWRRGSRLMAY